MATKQSEVHRSPIGIGSSILTATAPGRAMAALKSFGNAWLLVVCLSLLAAVMSVRVSGAAGAPSGINATVVNTTSNPVPVSGSVAVTNPASNPVQTQNVGGGAATQVGQPVSKVVNLTCDQLSPTACKNLATNATFSIPAGEALIITDFQWAAGSSRGQGNYDVVDLFAGNHQITDFSALVDAAGFFAGQVHLATGIVVSPGSSVTIETTSSLAINSFLQGYLVPNQ